MACVQSSASERAVCTIPPTVSGKRATRPSPVDTRNKSNIQITYSNLSQESLVQGGFSLLSCYPICSSRMNTLKLATMPPPLEDPIDFADLPPAVRRKMFSSHERLRLALGQYQLSHAPLPLKHGRTLSSSSSKMSRANSPRGKLKKTPPADAFLLSQTDAQWFLNLPETVKRKHFTREERELLAGRCQAVIMDAADETLYRMGQQANKSCGTLDSSTSTVSRSSGEPKSPAGSFELFDWRTSFKWMDEGDDLDLRLHLEDHQHETYVDKSVPVDKPLPQTPPSDHPRRRTFSLTSKGNPTNTSAPSGLFRRQSISNLTQRPTIAPRRNVIAIESEAAYYRDPEARLKLRVYLASAQKFDEAIEFGFPSHAEVRDCRPATAAAASLKHHRNSQTFLFSDDKMDDDDEKSEDLSVTLAQKFEQSKRLSRQLSVTSPPHSSKPNLMVGHYPLTSAGNREMTLRMTLTRPDLRAEESQLYGWKKDPLALEPLPPVCDKEPGMGPFDTPPWFRDEDPGLVKKLWRKVKQPLAFTKRI